MKKRKHNQVELLMVLITIITLSFNITAATFPNGLSDVQWQNIENQVATSSQQAYIKASNTGSGDYFANSLSLYGDILAVGAFQESSNATGINGVDNNLAISSGAVYTYNRIDGNWFFDSYIKASNSEAGDKFGVSVAVYQDTMVVGAQSEDSNAIVIDGDQNNNLASGSGAVYVFNKVAGNWLQTAYLKAPNTETDDRFGETVAIFGDYIAVSATGEDSSSVGVGGNHSNNDQSNSGAVYLYKRVLDSWQFDSYIKATNPDSGDRFGDSLALSAETLVVGTPFEDSNSIGVGGIEADNSTVQSGAVYVYQLTNGLWEFQAYIKASNTDTFDSFGKSVDIFNNTIVVGAWRESSNAIGVNGDDSDNSANGSGAAYVFTRSNSDTWSQQAYIKPSNTESSDGFGFSVSIENKVIVITAINEESSATGVNGDENNNDLENAGAAYVFVFQDNVWQQLTYIKPFNTDVSDKFGWSASLSNNTVVFGARFEDSNSTGINGADNNLVNWSGAAYVFDKISDFVFSDSFE